MAIPSLKFSSSSPHHFQSSPVNFKIQFLQFIFFIIVAVATAACHNLLPPTGGEGGEVPIPDFLNPNGNSYYPR